MHTATKAPFLTFVRTNAEHALRVADTKHNNHLHQGAYLSAAATYDQLLLRYQTFVDASIEDYQQVYKHYRQQGGEQDFFEQCWNLLLHDAVAEAANLLNEYDKGFHQTEKLWQDLKRISEGCLLVLDKAMA